MLYLLDANVPMTAHSQYYGIDMVPEFWSWLVHRGQAGSIKMPRETYDEIKDGSTDAERDLLYAWAQDAEVNKAILLTSDVDPALVRYVLSAGYAPDLNDVELEQIGQDPLLIAHAMQDPENRCVVTTESSAPSRRRQNRRIPDVCRDVGVKCCDTFAMLRALGFKTAWRPK